MLLGRLNGAVLTEGVDRWYWKPEKEGVFSVKTFYLLIQNLIPFEGGLTFEEEVIFREIWKSKASAKVVAFSWTLLLDRIPTKVNLAYRGLLGADESKRCVFCGSQDELVVHLFLHCDIISKVWREVMNWLNFNFISPPNLFIHAICWSRHVRNKKLRRGAWLIWHAVVWVVWKTRNNWIFNNKTFDVMEMVDEMKLLS